MKPTILVLAAMGLCSFAAGPVVAQQTPTQSGPSAATSTPAAPAPARASQSGPTGSLHMSHGKWRTSQLVGATVYNEHGDSIGTVDDLMMGNNGEVSDAILSVGGFLGIGAKLVSVPFNQLKLEPSKGGYATASTAGGAAGVAPGAPAATTPPAGGAGAPGAAGGAAVGGNAAAAPPLATAPAGNAAGEGKAPEDYSLVLPGATKDSLTKAPEFKYRG